MVVGAIVAGEVGTDLDVGRQQVGEVRILLKSIESFSNQGNTGGYCSSRAGARMLNYNVFVCSACHQVYIYPKVKQG